MATQTLVAPQLATLVESPPAGKGWIHEPKYDGYRILAHKHGGNVSLVTRNEQDYSAQFPAIRDAVAKLPGSSFIIDGELVRFDSSRRMSFQSLQQAFKDHKSTGLEYIVFDLLELNGRDLKRAPL